MNCFLFFFNYQEFISHIRRGERITVYGEESQDGFFVGEWNGSRGFIPSSVLSVSNEDCIYDSNRKHLPLKDFKQKSEPPDYRLRKLPIPPIDTEIYETDSQDGKICT